MDGATAPGVLVSNSFDLAVIRGYLAALTRQKGSVRAGRAWAEFDERGPALLASCLDVIEALIGMLKERGFHLPIHHYWHGGVMVEASPGSHGEECDKCEPVLALVTRGQDA